jgi:hypothetical protein
MIEIVVCNLSNGSIHEGSSVTSVVYRRKCDMQDTHEVFRSKVN